MNQIDGLIDKLCLVRERLDSAGILPYDDAMRLAELLEEADALQLAEKLRASLNNNNFKWRK